jgi:hypothetical protein
VAARGPADARRVLQLARGANSGPLLALLAPAYWPARTVVTAPVRTVPAYSAEGGGRMIPAWLLDVFAGVMLAVVAVSAARIAAARPWRGGQPRPTSTRRTC